MEDLKNNLNREHFMKIEYSDGTIHNVDCYKFAKAILENGEEVFFIEYKDYDNKRDGEYTDSYCIVVNVNGKWKKSDRKIDYSHLSQKTIHQYDPKLLGNYLDFYHLSNSFTPNQLNSSTIKKRIQPQTQTQSEREKQPPIVNDEEDDKNEYFITKEEAYIAQTQTQPIRDKVPPHYLEKEKEKKEVFICIPTDSTKKYVNVDSLRHYFESGDKLIGLLYSGIKEDVPITPKDRIEIENKFSHETSYKYVAGKKNFASFNIVSLSNQFFSIFGKQINQLIEQAKEKGVYDAKGIWEKGFFLETIEFDKFQSIETDDTIYKFVPCNINGVNVPFNDYYTKIDILVNQDKSNLFPDKILEGYLDYSIPMAKEFIDYLPGRDDPEYKVEHWTGYTKDAEIKKLREKCEYLKRIIVNNQMPINTDIQENIYKGVKNK